MSLTNLAEESATSSRSAFAITVKNVRNRLVKAIYMPVLVSMVMLGTFVVVTRLAFEPLRVPTSSDMLGAVVLVGGALAISELLPGRQCGPSTSCGYVPTYHTCGFLYFCAMLGMHVGATVASIIDATFWADTFVGVEVLLQLGALALCWYLHAFPDETPAPHAAGIRGFFWGRSLHPRILRYDVKQMVNSRIGMMYWALLVTSYMSRDSSCIPLVCCALAQLLYIAKFFAWERGYFFTLDIMHDRAGYYLLWGCLVWLPHLYALPVRTLSTYGSSLTDMQSVGLLVVAVVATACNYVVDLERRTFRDEGAKTKRAHIAIKHRVNGEDVTSRLLLEGWWGRARHINYTFELALAWAWGGFGGTVHIALYLYPTFLTVLLLHRLKRDEDRCRLKYGQDYEGYCRAVPYRLIPYIF